MRFRGWQEQRELKNEKMKLALHCPLLKALLRLVLEDLLASPCAVSESGPRVSSGSVHDPSVCELTWSIFSLSGASGVSAGRGGSLSMMASLDIKSCWGEKENGVQPCRETERDSGSVTFARGLVSGGLPA